MAADSRKPDLVAIVGPTASGKSELAMQIALKYGAEIVAADSRTVYKGLNIGTAKPTTDEQRLVKHWGIDLVDPGQRFTAADFKIYAQSKIAEINAREKLAILVGGTGLYVDSVLYDFEFGPDADPQDRERLEELSVYELQQLIESRRLPLPPNQLNRRHLIRRLERGLTGQKHKEIRPRTLLAGLMPAPEVLRQRIAARAQRMFDEGVIDEARWLINNYSGVEPRDYGIVYKLCSGVLSGSITREQAVERFATLDWQYAKRQKTWFKRNSDIHWFESISNAAKFIDSVLNT